MKNSCMTNRSSPARKYAAGLIRPFRLKKSQEICSAKRVRTVLVGPLGALEDATLDEPPDAADRRHEEDQCPPTGLTAVMPALGVEREYEVERTEDVDDEDDAVGQ